MSTLDQLLDQADRWVDKNEVTHDIATMDGRYALNVYNWIKSRAMQIGFHYALNLAGMHLPDLDIEAVRSYHTHAVNTIRANVLADLTKDMP